MVHSNMRFTTKDEGGLGMNDVATQCSISTSMWVVRCLEGSSPWQILMQHMSPTAWHVGKVKGQCDLCDIILAP